ncbi:MAG: cytochrome c [Myxococcaceae bacterium]|nr:cytochrome c [Myxococcaceae bacterium]MCI0672198.1 cytochrome c [Myxococcaceae bacterium]
MRRLLLGLAALAVTGCEIDSRILQRMEVQPKYKAYQENDFFADHRAMREPPFGTIPRERPAGNPGVTAGAVDGVLVSQVPIQLTPEVLARGKHKYDIVCSQCHGVLGDGNSIVAENMALRLPPSLVALKDKPAGHFYQAITYGYGVMPSFAGEIRLEDRWAVVAYVRALQRSQNVPLAEAPAQVQEQLRRQTEEGRP